MKAVPIGGISVGAEMPLALIAGPCVIENEIGTIKLAEQIRDVVGPLGIPFVFKASYEKDNRSSVNHFRGPGLHEGLRILERVRHEVDVPVLSDVHRETDVSAAASVLDVLQVPAFLCQQTSLLLAVGRTGKPVNIKKGQFLSPHAMKGPVEKVLSTGNDRLLLTERGSAFGYDRLVCDMCSIVSMHDLGFPVVFDATHSVRLSGRAGSDSSGGEPQFIECLALAAVAAGCDALFIETHPEPATALCDAASMLATKHLGRLLAATIAVRQAVRG